MSSINKVMVSLFKGVVGDAVLVSQANVQYIFKVQGVSILVHLATDCILDFDVPQQVRLDDIVILSVQYSGNIGYSLVS